MTLVVSLAHLGEVVEEHPETVQEASDVAAIDPIYAAAAVVAAAVIGFLVWRLLLKK